MLRFGATPGLAIVVLGVSAPLLAFNKPAVVTSAYEVLEPETWGAKKLSILEQIDIAEKLERGTWLILPVSAAMRHQRYSLRSRCWADLRLPLHICH